MQTTWLSVSETAEWLSNRDNFLILTHRRPDGDTLGSAAGLCHALRKIGKRAYVLNNAETGARYLDYIAPYYAPAQFSPETIITVDTADVSMFARHTEAYLDRVDLCIDHHISNTGYATYTCNLPTRAACGEVVYEILMALLGEIDAVAALPLYVALATDTGCFAYANVTAETLDIAGKLVLAGADHAKVNKTLFRTKTRGRIALEGVLYTTMRYYHDAKTAVSVITTALMTETGATEDDIDDIAALPNQVEGVLVGLTIRELGDNICKVSVRTGGQLSANEICHPFGGGGHTMAAGCVVKQSPEDTAAAVIAVVGELFLSRE